MKKLIILFFSTTLVVLNSSCVQQTRPITITFEVDMTEVENVKTVAAIGEYAPFSWDQKTELTDLDGDGIYTGTFTFEIAYNYMEFKFVVNDNIIELEGKNNRQVNFAGETSVTYRGVFDKASEN